MTTFLGRRGWTSPQQQPAPAPVWTQVAFYAQGGASAGWGGFTLRTRIRPPALNAPTGPLVRARLRMGNLGGQLLRMFACMIPAGQTSFVSGTTWVPVLFGGATEITLPPNATQLTDGFTLDQFGTLNREQILLSCAFGAAINANVLARINTEASQTNWRSAFLAGDSANTVGAWAGTAPNSTYLIDLIETSPAP